VFVEVSVVDTHSPFVVFLSNKHRIGEPVRMKDFFDESCRE